MLTWQVACALNGCQADSCDKLVIAYGPVWAIGTDSTATPTPVQEAHAIIRMQIAQTLGSDLAQATRIVYGGSVRFENVAALMAQPDIDGALVGGASLDPDTFCSIVQYQAES